MEISFMYLLENLQFINESSNFEVLLEIADSVLQQSTDILRQRPQSFPYIPNAIDQVMLKISSMLKIGEYIQLSTDVIHLEIEAHDPDTWSRKWRFPSRTADGAVAEDEDDIHTENDTIELIMPPTNHNHCTYNVSMATIGLMYRGVSDRQNKQILGSNVLSTTLSFCDDVISVPATFSLTVKNDDAEDTRKRIAACSYLDFDNM
ncbi:uncharacterized protein [Ptychodera flava]|uniref:uncharacterized protein n=1 Tax=Ptychodera flava TaxID=63121 RepID=UPI00396A5C3A